MSNSAKQTAKTSNTGIDAGKIVARIVKGFMFLNMDATAQQEQRNFVAATVHSDFDTLDVKEFAKKYVEWVPVELTAKILGIKKDAVTKLIDSAGRKQPKGKVVKTPTTKPANAGVQKTMEDAPQPQAAPEVAQPEAPQQTSDVVEAPQADTASQEQQQQ
jgi:hypothetical protein